MNIYFFYKNESRDHWYDCTIEAWSENDNTYYEGKRASSFSLLESLHIHICKDYFRTLKDREPFLCARITHEYGTNLSLGHNARTPQEFIHDKRNRIECFETCDHKTFQRFKKKMLEIYAATTPVNYTEILMQDSTTCRMLY